MQWGTFRKNMNVTTTYNVFMSGDLTGLCLYMNFPYQIALLRLLLSVPVVVNDASQDESGPSSMGGHHTFILEW